MRDTYVHACVHACHVVIVFLYPESCDEDNEEESMPGGWGRGLRQSRKKRTRGRAQQMSSGDENEQVSGGCAYRGPVGLGIERERCHMRYTSMLCEKMAVCVRVCA